MALPSYADLGKSIRDLFSKGYQFGQLKVTAKSTTCHNVEINTNISHTLEDKSTVAEIQAKYNPNAYGLKLVNKWTTDNLFSKELTCQDYLASGLKLGLEVRYNIDTSNKGCMFMGQYKHDNATLDMSMEGGDDANLLVNTSVVAGYQSYIAGYEISYDTNDGTLKKNNACVGYLGSGFSSLLNLENMETLSGSYYQEVNSNLVAGFQGNVKGEDGPTFAMGAKYIIDPSGVIVRGKVDNKSQLGVGCEVKVTDGVALLLSTNIDLKDFTSGAHKVGLGLDFQ